ncbi:MAG TPA: glycosyltransferase family A protein [Pedobacter sp.]|uniref:glycosyltransferase family A protein n=1 Tax=Pedobacter sp. TaxID=1411316 RepID=UPI002BE56D0C|nr:glycosyltransferase family A protein [Pedobacter sp.]HMI01965.1 glycosyltransferase family A protein [Pedobacter sp.]
MNHAPIILFVHNRPEHTKKVIESLHQNTLSKETELYIYADAAKDEAALTGVDLVRDYLPTISGFKSVHICLRETNLGVDENIISGVTDVLNTRGKAIVLEDDLVTSPWFLQYMNDALNFYQDREEVASIHAYTYPIPQKLKEVFFLKGADCWGWATWKNRWSLFERDGTKLLSRIVEQKLESEFNFDNTYPYVQALRDQAEGRTKCWDIRWYASAFLEKKLTLYPGQSLVHNIGHDASGSHCGDTRHFDVLLSQSSLNIVTDVLPDAEAYHAFADFLRTLPSHANLLPKSWLSRSFKSLKSLIRKT